MKKQLILLLLLTVPVFAQWELRGSMGLNMVNMPDLRDYLNGNFSAGGSLQNDFNSKIEFGIEAGNMVSATYQTGAEATVQISSYTSSLGGSQYEFNYQSYSLSSMHYYVIQGKGYRFKFGGGAGPRFFTSSEKIYTNQPVNRTSFGAGVVAKLDASTAISNDVYAYIAFDLRYDYNGEPEGDGKKIMYSGSPVTVNALSAGIKLGVSFLL